MLALLYLKTKKSLFYSFWVGGCSATTKIHRGTGAENGGKTNEKPLNITEMGTKIDA